MSPGPTPGACSLHVFYNQGISIFNKYLGYTGAGGSLVHTLKMTGLYLEPTSGLYLEPYCPQVWGHGVGALHQCRKLGQVSGALTHFCTWALGLAQATCKGVRYFNVFEGVSVCPCMFVACVCVSPSVWWASVHVSICYSWELASVTNMLTAHLCLPMSRMGLYCVTWVWAHVRVGGTADTHSNTHRASNFSYFTVKKTLIINYFTVQRKVQEMSQGKLKTVAATLKSFVSL